MWIVVLRAQQYDWTVFVGAQNIDGCTFEEDSCGFAGVNWMRNRTSTTGLQYDNTFRTVFGKMLCCLQKLLKCHLQSVE